MGKRDLRVWAYLGSISLIITCCLGAYGLVFSNVSPTTSRPIEAITIHPLWVIVLATILSVLNSFAVNVLSDEFIKGSKKWASSIKYAIVGSVFIITMLGTILITWKLSG